MLQKGFLQPKNDQENDRALKKSRIISITGVVIALFSLMYMMSLLTNESFTSRFSAVTMAGMAMIGGIIMVCVGIWMNFFAQNKKYKTGV